MTINFKPVLVALAIGFAAAPALAQTAPRETEATRNDVTAGWLVGHWSAQVVVKSSSGTGHTFDTGGIPITTYSTSESTFGYWLDMDIARDAKGALEATVTARQMSDDTEFVTWKSTVVVEKDAVRMEPGKVVGKKEWWSYTPDQFLLRRRGEQLVGGAVGRWMGLEVSNQIVAFER